LRDDAFPSRLRTDALTARAGTLLGACMFVAFVTGLASHLAQHPAWGLAYPTRPVQLYRVTQGVHVASGLACIPLLLVKLWSVYPRLWAWPPVRGVVHAAERLSLLVLVGSAVLQLFSGLTNIFYWYPWPFFFTTAHYWTAWVLAGSVMLHVAIKWPRIAAGWRTRLEPARVPVPDEPARDEPVPDEPVPDAPAATPGGLSRRGLLTATVAAAGTVALVTVGETVRPLAALDLLAARRPATGPQRLPVNRTARAAGVTAAARDAGYRLEISGRVRTPVQLTLAELRALPQRTAALPIACVEGWSTEATWTGVPIHVLLDLAGAPASARMRVQSIERFGRYGTSTLEADAARDRLTLLALRLNGDELAIDHGFPCRLIAPDLPGVLQTKWVRRVEVL
jgi:DMSO/TMAO reductase YedYZ molybdopterin-dependent catalytic subunit